MSNVFASGTELRVCHDIAKRQERGLLKYGVSVEANHLNLRQWLQHAYEETLDQAIYLRRAIDEMDALISPQAQSANGSVPTEHNCKAQIATGPSVTISPNKESTINWRDWHTGLPYATPMASSLSAGHYFTGNPSMGWVLYSRGGSCWQTRTKPEFPPHPGMIPVRTSTGWVWKNEKGRS